MASFSELTPGQPSPSFKEAEIAYLQQLHYYGQARRHEMQRQDDTEPVHIADSDIDGKLQGEAVLDRAGIWVDVFDRPFEKIIDEQDISLHNSPFQGRPVPTVTNTDKYIDFITNNNRTFSSTEYEDGAALVSDVVEAMHATVGQCFDSNLRAQLLPAAVEQLDQLAASTLDAFAVIRPTYERFNLGTAIQYDGRSHAYERMQRLIKFREKGELEAYAEADFHDLTVPYYYQDPGRGPAAWHRTGQRYMWDSALEFLGELREDGNDETAGAVKQGLLRTIDDCVSSIDQVADPDLKKKLAFDRSGLGNIRRLIQHDLDPDAAEFDFELFKTYVEHDLPEED